ncbi:class I SAM-dependent DNA methyltransferase [Acinetobacter sp. ANC 4648]|uniref:class I SAM-dependent DNA methyltransferase n=1 Tax=Acinetobacter sp. ANC 4648 TaxID=1977875 RepID=UPI000A34016B|nr:class I SAM-dependent methyltransferase [Acinetobacter sp. ANC 4648]OTG83996.1 SAM-dependent methyltransferase [Acinetobacter sp. ANC 4648]
MSEQPHLTDQSFLAQNIIEIYKKHARAWTELRGDFLYEKAWLDHFLSFISPQSDILDLGCGSGKPIANYLIQNGHVITGVDSSDTMIAMAQQNFLPQKFPDHQWIHADMRAVNLQKKFQGILAWDSFFHLTPNDQQAMFQQFSKSAEQGTVLMFTSGPADGEVVGDMFGEALYHASLSQDKYRQLLSEHSFELVSMVAEDVECAGHTVWLARHI